MQVNVSVPIQLPLLLATCTLPPDGVEPAGNVAEQLLLLQLRVPPPGQGFSEADSTGLASRI